MYNIEEIIKSQAKMEQGTQFLKIQYLKKKNLGKQVNLFGELSSTIRIRTESLRSKIRENFWTSKNPPNKFMEVKKVINVALVQMKQEKGDFIV